MAMGKLSQTEQQILDQNPNVVKVNEDRVTYSAEFKQHFLEEYEAGRKPTEIFVAAGFDKEILGRKRIERAAARWRKRG